MRARAAANDWGSQITSEPRAQYRPTGGLTPLLYAARSGCTECVQSILAAARRSIRSQNVCFVGLGAIGTATLRTILGCVDHPSHITLLNKDLLRLMFVLEGCRSRPDLEQQMDWGGKGRVLVLEKWPPSPTGFGRPR